MNVLFLSTWFPCPIDNGSKIRVYHLLQALAERHRVSLLSFAFETARPEAAVELGRLCSSVQAIPRNPFERSRIANVLRFLSLAPIMAAPVREMELAVRATLAQHSYDVVIASTEVMAAYALMASRSMKILEEHNSLTRWMGERYKAQTLAVQRMRCWLSWQKTRHYEARTLGRFDLCTMVSEQDRQVALSLLPGYRGPVEVIPNGVDCERNRPGLFETAPNTLVFNGSLTYSANYDAMQYFLDAVYPLIRARLPDISLAITGSLQGVDVSGLRLDGSVRLCGQVEDVRPLVAGASVCVVPIRQGGGTRLKILEAMALGTPVVTTTKGAEGLDLTPGSEILIADAPDDFASTVLRLLHDSTLRDRLARNARRLAERCYDWTEIGKRFVSAVEGAAERRSDR